MFNWGTDIKESDMGLVPAFAPGLSRVRCPVSIRVIVLLYTMVSRRVIIRIKQSTGLFMSLSLVVLALCWI